jgi:hypothetical protein
MIQVRKLMTCTFVSPQKQVLKAKGKYIPQNIDGYKEERRKCGQMRDEVWALIWVRYAQRYAQDAHKVRHFKK